ncbi:MAG: P-II family nitrogen regulator [Methylocystis sp.]|jgi:nitrogen regulatory protein P-II 2
MKCVVAIIRPFKLVDVKDALIAAGVAGLTVSEVRGYGRQRGHTDIYRGTEYTANFIPKLKLEIVVTDDAVEAAIQTILSVARTGTHGDGKIFVFTMDQVVRIRTAERDNEAV